MIGKTISHFRITGEIGGGGMGVVYQAIDTKLDRPVALKFLPPELTRDAQAKQRFIREAKAASALQHHNICTIHEIDESDDGHLFIAMDCYEGETLKQKIARGPMAVDEVIEIARQVTSGLAEAHASGMVHRDIKPANIMVTGKGVAKILDFGLAKLTGQTKVTKTGTSVGTVAYMSPEQARGEEVDVRSDIFSLGVVFYEALTGEQPFKGEHEAAVLYGIINTKHQSIAGERDEIPAALVNIIEKCLAKEASSRYRNGMEMLTDLQQLLTGSTVAQASGSSKPKRGGRVLAGIALVLVVLAAGYFITSNYLTSRTSHTDGEIVRIAILPFENLGPEEDEYFASGMTEEITARLAGIQDLGVIARTSVLQYKNTEKSIEQIGEELDVNYILEGTVRWQKFPDQESQVRITPQLIRVSGGTHVWAEIYDESIRDIFKIQASVARQVVAALNVTLLEREQAYIDTQPTSNTAAMDYYMRGNDYFKQRHLEPEKRKFTAIQFYERAIAEDPEFAEAYAMLAWAYTELYWHNDKLSEYEHGANQAIEKAQSLRPDNYRVRLVSGVYDYHFLRYDKASAEFNALLKLNPNNAELLAETAYVFTRKGDWERGIELLERALRLDPRSYKMTYEIALRKQMLRRFDDAEHHYRRALQLAPDYEPAYIGYSKFFISRNGDAEAARKVLDNARSFVTQSPDVEIGIRYFLACEGKYPGTAEECFGMFNLGKDNIMAWGSPAVWGAVLELMGENNRIEEYYEFVIASIDSLKESDVYGLKQAMRAVALAGLGQKREAITLGRESVQLAGRNAWMEHTALELLARIYILTNEYDEAVAILDRLLSIPGLLTVPLMRIDPRWVRLRNHPDFLKLLERHESAANL